MSQNDIDKARANDLITPSGQTNDSLPDEVKADENANDEAVLKTNNQESSIAQSEDVQDNQADAPTPKKGGNGQTLMVALILCLVCSILVSAVAVGLKPKQQANQALDRNKNILIAGGLAEATATSSEVDDKFKDFEVKLVNLATGKYATSEELSSVGIGDVSAYDANAASKDPKLNNPLTEDPAGIKATPKFAKIYVKPDAEGKPELVVLPVHGYGLWGTMYAFLTLEGDLNTIKGISFYEHKETPGLGALVAEPKWRNQLVGKQAYNENGQVATGVVKAGTPKPNPNYVDGVSGATLTSRGVHNLLQFWLGEQGYKPFLDNLKKGGA
ncbi:Na(+)-translocating NADH-quinone reductase subunit C [Moraxella sp. ZY200743]|uniref:Na(+)-translocating NADH-quinone reductase subunit C n=1 Tax=Moraxella sp. ZY200743 TaxID=2911970 RepID=UPI003D7CEA6D